MEYDVIIIGGSYAGLSAGLQLARARRRVLVVDADQRRNRYAPHSHGFLGQDGVRGEDIAAEGRSQLMEYGTLNWLVGHVQRAEIVDQGFNVTLQDGARKSARRILLATGVSDELPDVPGVKERWGKDVFHCPYCHGYELGQAPIGVLATSPMSMHQALMLPDWGPTTLFLNGVFEPDEAQRSELAARGVTVEQQRVLRLQGATGVEVVLQDGRSIPVAGVFVATRTRPSTPIAEQLGCELEESPMGWFVKTDTMKATTVPGVFACGDVARAAGSVALAVGDGAMAGAATHRSLMFG